MKKKVAEYVEGYYQETRPYAELTRYLTKIILVVMAGITTVYILFR